MQMSVVGVFAVGDANNNGSTNMPHAMFSGKRAAVCIHVKLAREEARASLGKQDTEIEARELQGEAEPA
ncbi:hypothetical protein D8B26_006828 [Coccidioides posadasii str. Silveira]|uniref:Predicted protein n=2 Tax=Coccidioides posadasii TaxID=199306 RepID=E9CRV9_COCPS|nr:sulphydryl oxidase, putative [Coccidioides posadasii C735 delta SOWgp]EER28156.1 sulphydryl oxidase, putative [Coccidioides posadasii C735 delta SOWgp]EFW23334.1 predicted protein [Coccidioides posadasii str. Silveira]QVM12193.1 hypothetical protein D8B26_006828 [Coccidioides posadasii str. Silveira]|eukprot:XP_003070301.1 sulphydryl oxidase, putative [Coccidioides posadasii C735 delta SOWgp]